MVRRDSRVKTKTADLIVQVAACPKCPAQEGEYCIKEDGSLRNRLQSHMGRMEKAHAHKYWFEYLHKLKKPDALPPTPPETKKAFVDVPLPF